MKGHLSRLIELFVMLLVSVLVSCAPVVSQVATPVAEKSQIQEIQVLPDAEKTSVFIVGEEPMVYTAFNLLNPDRLVIDIVGVGLGTFTDKINLPEGPIRLITPKMTVDGKVARIEMEFSKSAQTRVRPEGATLVIEAIVPAEIALEKSIEPVNERANGAVPEKEVSKGGVEQQAQEGVVPKQRLRPAEIISDIRFDRKEGLQLVVVSDGDLSPHPFYLDAHRLVIDFPAVKLAKKKVEAISANDRAVKQVRVGEHPDKVRLVLDILTPVEYFLQQVGNELRVSLKEVPFERIEERIRTDVAIERKERKAVPASVSAVVEERDEPVNPSKYVGRKISLDFQDAEISDIIRLIAEVSTLNIVLGEEVKGKMTLKLANVPWDQALETILRVNTLGQQRDGSIIVISSLASITQRQEEEAKAKDTGMRAEDRVTRVIYLNYAQAQTLSEPLKKLLSPRGDISVDIRTNTMVVKDIPSSIEDVVKMAKTLDTRTPQVSIEARIVQVSPKFTRSLGVQWGANYGDILGGNIIRLATPNGQSPGGFGAIAPGLGVNVPASNNLGGVGFTFGRFTDSPITLDLRLSAGETQGLTKIVSTPKVTVLDNLKATISQGESIPFQTSSSQGGTQTTFQEAALTLEVTPHISSDGGIIMNVKVKKNAPGEQRSNAGPSIIKKEAETSVLILDGETIAVGGIQETVEAETTSGIPFLMDIPFIGRLFKNKEVRKENTELLVFITPKIVR
jgi:type IV pilus assembly protein PilQ